MSDVEYDVDDFLAHYGVKGMRWGHRKQAANEKLRTKLAGKAEDRLKEAKGYVKNNREAVKDIQANGAKSKHFQAYKEKAFVDTANGLIRQGYDPYSAKINALILTSGYSTKDAIKELAGTQAVNETRVKEWTSVNQKLMSMDMSEVSKRDIRRAYGGR